MMIRRTTFKPTLLTVSEAEDAIKSLEGRKEEADEAITEELSAALHVRFRTKGGAPKKSNDSPQLQGDLKMLHQELRDQYVKMLEARIGALRALVS